MYRIYTFQVDSWISAINMSHDVQCKQAPSWNDFYENAEDFSFQEFDETKCVGSS